jgi:hypothetical protein
MRYMLEKRCVTCQVVRPVSEFKKRRAAEDGLQSRCRQCSRDWYLAHKDEHVVDVRRRNARVRAGHQDRLADYLLEHPCVDCGETDVRVLEFDHEDPSSKAAEIGRLAACSMPWNRIQAEIEKCSVRCANCHRRRTATMRGYWRDGVEVRRRADEFENASARLAALLA